MDTAYRENSYACRGYAKWLLKDYIGSICYCSEVINLKPNDGFAYCVRGASILPITNEGCLDFKKSDELDYEKAYDASKKYCN